MIQKWGSSQTHLRKIQTLFLNPKHILLMTWAWHTQCIFSKRRESLKPLPLSYTYFTLALVLSHNVFSSSLPHPYVKLNSQNTTSDFIDLITKGSLNFSCTDFNKQGLLHYAPHFFFNNNVARNDTSLHFVLFSLLCFLTPFSFKGGSWDQRVAKFNDGMETMGTNSAWNKIHCERSTYSGKEDIHEGSIKVRY